MRTDFFYRAEEIIIQRGWSVFPVGRETKIPCLQGGRNNSTKDIDQILEWGKMFPDANVAVPTGADNGIFVLDFDTPDALPNLRKLGSIPQTLTASSGRGSHMYFHHIGGKVVNRAGKLVRKSTNPWRGDDWVDVQGMDIRGDGGSIIAPPSIHSSGRQYRWLDGCDVLKLPPLWLCRMIGEKQEAKRRKEFDSRDTPPALEKCVDIVLSAKEGGRNAALNTASFLAGKGVDRGAYSESAAKQVLLNAALSIGLTKDESIKTIISGIRHR